MKTCPLVVNNKKKKKQETTPSPIPATTKLHHPFLWTRSGTRSVFKRTRRRTGTNVTSTFIQPHQLNGLFSSQGRNKRRCCSPKLHKTSSQRTKKKRSSMSLAEAVTCCTVCFVRRCINTKDNYTFSRAGLLPPTLQKLNRTDEITERQTALAHSVCRVYMTMLK